MLASQTVWSLQDGLQQHWVQEGTLSLGGAAGQAVEETQNIHRLQVNFMRRRGVHDEEHIFWRPLSIVRVDVKQSIQRRAWQRQRVFEQDQHAEVAVAMDFE